MEANVGITITLGFRLNGSNINSTFDSNSEKVFFFMRIYYFLLHGARTGGHSRPCEQLGDGDRRCAPIPTVYIATISGSQDG